MKLTSGSDDFVTGNKAEYYAVKLVKRTAGRYSFVTGNMAEHWAWEKMIARTRRPKK